MVSKYNPKDLDSIQNPTTSIENQKPNDSNKNDGASTTPTSVMKRKQAPKARRNIMAESFKAFHAAGGKLPLNDHKYVYEPEPFFFYGTLSDPLKLQEVLQLPSPPVLTPGKIKSYAIKLWGQYPALVEGPMSNILHGMTYMIETEEQVKILQEYETKAYKLRGVLINIDGKRVSGSTFMWAKRDTSELTDGTWSLEEWKRDVEEEMASHFRPVEDVDRLTIDEDGS